MDADAFQALKFPERVETVIDLLLRASLGDEEAFYAMMVLMHSSTLFTQVMCMRADSRNKFAGVIKLWAVKGCSFDNVEERACVFSLIMRAMDGIIRFNHRIHFLDAVDALMANDALSEVARLLIQDTNVTDMTYQASSQLLVLYSIHKTPTYRSILMRVGLLDTCARIHKLAHMDEKDADYVLLAKFINDNVLYLLHHIKSVLAADKYEDTVSAMEVVCEFLASLANGPASDFDNKSRLFVKTIIKKMIGFLCEVSTVITTRLDDLTACKKINMSVVCKIVACMDVAFPVATTFMLGGGPSSNNETSKLQLVFAEVCTWVASLEPMIKTYVGTVGALVRMDSCAVGSDMTLARLLRNADDESKNQEDGGGFLMASYQAEKEKTRSLKQALSVVQSENLRLQTDIDATECDIKELRHKAAILDKEHEVALHTARTADERNTKLISTCSRLQEANSKLVDQRRELMSQNASLQSEIDRLSLQSKRKSDTINKLHDILDTLQIRCKGICNRIAALGASHQINADKARGLAVFGS
jgi:hypothetical protein